MKQEFKWYLTIEIEVDEDAVGTDDEDCLYNEAMNAMNYAQSKFFDALNALNANDNLASWRVLDEELK